MPSAPFISFEGGEGVGKSTQIKLLANHLTQAGVDCIATHEPGGTAQGQALRALLLEGAADKWSPMAETLLMLADRHIHLEKIIRPALAAGQWVLCDRYMDSSTAYQGAAGGLGVEMVNDLQAPIIGDTVPDLTFLLDVPVAEGLARAQARGQHEARFESKGTAYHEALRACFLDLAKAHKGRFVVIDARAEEEAVFTQIKTAIKQHFADQLSEARP